MSKRVLIALALGVTMTACAGAPGTLAATGRVTGHVSGRTCGGAAQENQSDCRFHPAPDVTLAFRQVASGHISVTTTDAGDAYAITLAPGTYSISPKNADSLGPVRAWAGPQVASVVAGKTVKADFSYTVQLL